MDGCLPKMILPSAFHKPNPKACNKLLRKPLSIQGGGTRLTARLSILFLTLAIVLCCLCTPLALFVVLPSYSNHFSYKARKFSSIYSEDTKMPNNRWLELHAVLGPCHQHILRHFCSWILIYCIKSWSRKYICPCFSPQHQKQYEPLYVRAMQNTGALASWFCIRLSMPHRRRGPRVGCSSGSLARVSWCIFQLCTFSLCSVASLSPCTVGFSLQLGQEWAPPRTETSGSTQASFKLSFLQAIHSCKPSFKGDCLLERERICIKLSLGGGLFLYYFLLFDALRCSFLEDNVNAGTSFMLMWCCAMFGGAACFY